ncbi:hypothetical protein [Providencia alcalifaciens]|uniref:hypothetical protein n=1 Tax=Providencia alcalifaciens TaxID=126385 RepID=UPI0002E8DE3A
MSKHAVWLLFYDNNLSGDLSNKNYSQELPEGFEIPMDELPEGFEIPMDELPRSHRGEKQMEMF